MTLAWAVRHPDKVRAWAGIYPVCNLASYPLKSSKKETLADFGLTEEQLVARLGEFNPIDNLAGLAKARVPLFAVHGDKDAPVPYTDNTKLLKDRYEAAGGTCTVKLIPGGRHEISPAFFECLELVEFVLKHAATLDVVVAKDAPGPVSFAAEEIWREAKARAGGAPAARVVLSIRADTAAAPQSYTIRVQVVAGRRTITVSGADAAGAMYGGLDIAEAIRTGRLDTLKDSDHTPHINQRGIKFNIPLDLRTPSYTDPCDASQANIPEMWSMDFWREMFDDMARHRYNLLSLWSLNPFPSIVKVPEFPNVALDDVWRTKERARRQLRQRAGTTSSAPAMLANHEVVRRRSPSTTEDQVLAGGHATGEGPRHLDVYWFTWNTFLFGMEGKDEITGGQDRPAHD